jgi:hypothetical protein
VQRHRRHGGEGLISGKHSLGHGGVQQPGHGLELGVVGLARPSGSHLARSDAGRGVAHLQDDTSGGAAQRHVGVDAGCTEGAVLARLPVAFVLTGRTRAVRAGALASRLDLASLVTARPAPGDTVVATVYSSTSVGADGGAGDSDFPAGATVGQLDCLVQALPFVAGSSPAPFACGTASACSSTLMVTGSVPCHVADVT